MTDVLPHVQRLYDNSECRTPLILSLRDGDPLKCIQALAKEKGCAVWHIVMDSPKNEQNALDYLDVGLQNGDWVYLTKTELAGHETLREIALQLLTVVPNPKMFPKREIFRMWIAVEDSVDLNQSINPAFPSLLAHNALYATARPTSPTGCAKLQVKRAVEPSLMAAEHAKRRQRKLQGRESDSESDAEDASQRRTGLWFHRSVDFFEGDNNHANVKHESDIFTAIEADDEEKVARFLKSNTLDINHVLRCGMTPLFWAVMCDNTVLIKMLLDAGADPNQRRQGNGMPIIFMSISQVDILQLLVEHGADLDARFEGQLLIEHPDTAPNIRQYLKANMY
ncbi:nuclear protein Tc22 [Diplonema papillatum]|nr:nuclear protein Tc22 [Diplonema papillatum]|eukprot:gene21508-33094_t